MKKLILVLIFLGILINLSLVSADEIIIKNSKLPSPRMGLSCAENSATNKIYCFGGFFNGRTYIKYFDEILEYDPNNDKLIIKNARLPTKRNGLSCTENSANNKIYCFGGSEAGKNINEILEYDPSNDKLIIKNQLPTEMSGLACEENSATNKIYCFGGYYKGLLNQIFEYNPSNGNLIIKKANLPSPRAHTSCIENSNTHLIYCFGGSIGNSLNEIIEYDPSKDILIVKKSTLPIKRSSLSCAENAATNKIYCFGGDNPRTDQIIEYNSFYDKITIKNSVLPSVNTGLSCAENSVTHKIYCFGGYVGGKDLIFLDQILEYSSYPNLGSAVNFTADFNNCSNGDNGKCAGFYPIYGTWKVQNGAYLLTPGTIVASSVVPIIDCANCTVTARVNIDWPFGKPGEKTGIFARFTSKGDAYWFMLNFQDNKVSINKGGSNILASKSYTLQKNTNYSISLKTDGNNLTGFINNIPIISVIDNNPIPWGTGGLFVLPSMVSTSTFDDFSIVSNEFYEEPKPQISITGTPKIGGRVDFKLIDHLRPNTFYFLLASLGDKPGTNLGGNKIIPLNPDGVFFVSLFSPLSMGLFASQSILDSRGEATAFWNIPNIPQLAGFDIYFAFVTIDLNGQVPDSIKSISPPKKVTLQK